MKKYLFSLFLVPFLVSFAWAYNCASLQSRIDSVKIRQENYAYDAQVLNAKKDRVSNQYQAAAWLEEAELLQAVWDQLKEEIADIQDEADRCDNQREKIADYLKQAGEYENELANAKQFSDYKQSTVDNAIKYYTKAYELMKGDSYLSMWMEKDIKNKVDSLAWFKQSLSDITKLTNLEQQAYDAFVAKDYNKALKLYKEVVSYKWTVTEWDYTSAESNISKLNEILKSQKLAEDAKSKMEAQELEDAKAGLWQKLALWERIVTLINKKEKKKRVPFIKMAEGFIESKDLYTKSAWVYMLHYIEQ